jgi:uncharacterized protein (TIGR03437 family)
MVRFAIWSCLFLSFPLFAQPPRIPGKIDDTHRVTLQGSLPPRAQAADDQGHADSSLQLGYVTLMLKPTAAQQAALDRLLEEQQERSSPNYHRWLAPEQFGDRFGLNTGDISKVRAWIESQGFHIETVARARTWIAFSGPAQAAERAFGAEIHRYSARGEQHYSNATELSVPEALADVVSNIRGLDDFWRKPDALLPEYTPGNGVNQLAPDDWTTIYDVKPLYNLGIDGTGQRLVIVGTSDFPQSYVDSFRSMFGLPPSQIEMHLIGPDPGVTSSQGEAALDLEWSGAIARNATIVYVYATNFNDAAQGAIDLNLGSALSQSFGSCEPTSAQRNRIIAQQANAQGITWMVSSGDSGGAACDPHGFFGVTGEATTAMAGQWVSVPAAFPEVTAVGGTEFNEGSGQYWSNSNNSVGGSALSYIPEMVWNETGGGGLLASGGGASTYFPKPLWQTGPGVPNDNARDVPDVSFSASGNHDPYTVVNANGVRATGGTSASSPSFAGVVALLSHYVMSKGIQAVPGLGNINPQLYKLAQSTANVFHDITVGNNMVPCSPGSLDCPASGMIGFNAGPGYDQATGLGSIDVYNLFTQWNTPAAASTTVVAVNPGNITLGGTLQVTAVVSAKAGGSAFPTGTVTFTCGTTLLGIAPLRSGGATLTVTGPQLPVGSTTVFAAYSGDSNFNGSAGTAVVNVVAAAPGSDVVISISPNPAHEGQFVRVALTEVAGVATTITDWSINGVDDFSRFVADFGTASIPAYGMLFSGITTAFPAVLPSARVYTFTGADANGRTWSQQYTLILEGALTPDVTLSGPLAPVQQNPAADPSCQWSHLLVLQEQNGMEVQLTRMLANGVDWTSRIQPLFGTTQLAPLGNLQATVCWPAGNPQTVNYEVDGTDQTGSPVTATVTTSLAAPASNPATFSVSPNAVTLTTANASQSATSSIAVNPGSSTQASTQPWIVSVFASDAPANWLTVTPLFGTGSQTVTVTAAGTGLSPGVQYAWLVFQSIGSNPQFIEVPVAFVLGASATINIGGITNGASFQKGFAPGMIMSIFGAQLAPSIQLASSLPLPLTMAGVSATVNGVAAPLYYVSPGQLNIQIPYETGSGPAVVGVNNNGQVASFLVTVTPSAPGIFTDITSTLVPNPSGKRGDTLSLFITGEGDVSPPLLDGATPFSATPVTLLPQPTLPVSMTIGGVPASIVFFGIPSGLAGTTQVNFVVPSAAPLGVQPVVVTVGGVASPAVNFTVLAP